MIRTTIRLDEDLFRDLKRLAARKGRTLTSLIEEALREKVRRSRSASASNTLPTLPVFHGTGTMPGVDIDDSSALLDLMEDNSSAHRGGALKVGRRTRQLSGIIKLPTGKSDRELLTDALMRKYKMAKRSSRSI